MSTIGLDTGTVRRRRAFRWAAMIGGAATVVVIGLLISELFSTTASDHAQGGINAWVVSEYDAAPTPVTFAIVPASLITTNPQFFFGTGDGSAGYYSERPIPDGLRR